jgi:serine/threonine-protein kinase
MLDDGGNGALVAGALPDDAPPEAVALEDEDRRNRKRLALIVLLLALLIGGAVAAYLLTRADKLTVPNEVGQTLTVAQTRLQNQGFTVQVIRRTSDRPKDRVIAQAPNPGEEVEKGDTVTLTVSDGPGEGVVPDVSGLSRKRAVAAIKKAGFKTRVEKQNSDSVSAGDAIGTEPEAGSQIDKGRTVTVLVSTGPEKVTVPDVTGQDRGSARAQLSGAGFQVSETTQESDRAPGTVLAQSPNGGAQVTKGSTVQIVVAKAKPKPKPKPVDDRVAVPDVTGKDRDAAVNALSGAGFRASVTEKKVDNADDDGKVLSQSPNGGQKAKKGGAVKLVVGSFEPDVNPNEQPPDSATPTTPSGTP